MHCVHRRRYNHPMQHAMAKRLFNADELAALNTAQLVELVQTLTQTIATLEHQLDWFKRQLFGSKSERVIAEPNAQQLHLADVVAGLAAQVEKRRTVAEHTRRMPTTDAAANTESPPFFDE